MQGEGAAAARGRRNDDLDAVAGQQPDRRRVYLRRQRLLNAALQQGDAHPPRAVGRVGAGQVLHGRQGVRRQIDQGAQAARQQPPDRPGAPGQPDGVGETRWVGDCPRDQPTQ